MKSLWLVCLIALGAIACGGGGGDDGDDPPSPPVLDESPPEVSPSGTATFRFHAEGATRFECQLDSEPATACTSPHSVIVGDGMHTLRITAFDGAMALPDPIVVTWLVDTTPPDTSITNAPAAFDNSLTTTFTFAGVPASDASSFECALDAGAFAACTSPHMLTTAAGAHTFYVRAKDLAGNVDPTPAQHAWTIDSTILDTTITAGPAMSSTTQGAVSFSFTASDAAATFECQIDTQLYAPCTTPAQFSNLTEGSHTFSVRARKGAAFDPTPASRTWTVDLSGPPVSITQTPPSQSNDPDPTFAFSSSDASATFECQVDNQPYAACTSPWTSASLFQATHTFRVRASDPAGNSTIATYTWVVDLTGPTLNITQSPSGSTGDPSATFDWWSPDAIMFECQIDGVISFVACSPPWTYVVPGGQRTFRLRGTDAAGNTSTATRTWTVNIAGPTVSLTNSPPALGNSSTATFEFTTAGSVDILDCSLDNAAYTPCTSPKTYTGLGDGAHVFVVRVRDTMGNAHTATSNFTIDTVPPVVTGWFAPPAITRDRHPVLGYYPPADMAQSYGLVDGAFGAGPAPGILNIAGTAHVSPANPLADGPHVLTARVYDAAGNFGEYSASFVVDATGPTVTLDTKPANPNTASEIATFTFSSPDAVGFECQLDTVAWTSCTSPFNALVADGVHTFAVRGLDTIGNTTIKNYVWMNRAQPHVTTQLGAYDNGTGVSVSWRGLPGNALDWISIAPAGSNDMTVTHRIYTNGAKSGTATLPGVTTNGYYVARAYVNDTYTKLDESTRFRVLTPCPTLTWGPDTAIHTPGDVASLAPYTDLGNLTISPYSNFEIDLPCLKSVGALYLNDNNGANQVLALRIPRLQGAGSVSLYHGPPILELDNLQAANVIGINQTPLPDLMTFQRVSSLGNLGINTSNGVVPKEAFESVTSLPASFTMTITGARFDAFDNVTTFGGPNITINAPRIGGFNQLVNVPGNLTVTGEIDGGFKSLATVGGDAVFRLLSGAQSVVLPSLTTVEGHLWFQPVAAFAGPTIIKTLSMPLLRRAWRLTVDGSTGPSSLERFDAPLLHDVLYQVEFRYLDQLPFCELFNLLDQLDYRPMYVTNQMTSGQYGTCTFNY